MIRLLLFFWGGRWSDALRKIVKDGYWFTGADVYTPVPTDEEHDSFRPGSINYMLEQIRERQTQPPLSPHTATKESS